MNIKVLLKSNHLYFTGLLLLVAGMPVSLFLTSLSQFVLTASFFLEGNFVEKFKRFFSNRIALLIAGIWLMHVIGLLWTTDLHEGFKDIRIKLPLLTLPVIIAGSRPLTKKQFNWVLLVFVFAVFCGTVVSIAVLTGIIPKKINDIRDVFIFHISHIRFALFTCLAIFILIWLAFRRIKSTAINLKIAAALCIAWFLVFLIIVESVTGLLIFSITSVSLLIYLAYTSSGKLIRVILVALGIIIPVLIYSTIKSITTEFFEKKPYEIDTNAKTLQGNYYFFNFNSPLYENGYPVWMYICEDELKPSWNNVSAIPYDSLDEKGQPIKFTIVRFLSSKGLRKDAEAVNSLSEKERKSIERGIANVNYQNMSSMKSRLTEIIWEIDQFRHGMNPSGHSVTQRYEFWRAAWGIAKTNLIFGVGTGDMPSSYKTQYELMNSGLDKDHRLRAHNQFLAILVAFGITGLLYFIFAFFYPILKYKSRTGFLFCAFFIIALLSMFTEDTIETQAGATFISIFLCLFLFGNPNSVIEEVGGKR